MKILKAGGQIKPVFSLCGGFESVPIHAGIIQE